MTLERIRETGTKFAKCRVHVHTYMYGVRTIHTYLFCLSSLAEAEGGRQPRLHSNLNMMISPTDCLTESKDKLVNIMHPFLALFLSLLWTLPQCPGLLKVYIPRPNVYVCATLSALLSRSARVF